MILNRILNWFINKNKEWTYPKIKDGVPTKYGWVVRHPENFTLEEETDIGFGTYIQAENGVYIHKGTLIGSHCSIYSKNTIDCTSSEIHIGENVKIGAGTVILPKKDGTALHIGNNAKIGALSLVKWDIPSNSIVAGVPVRAMVDCQAIFNLRE